MTRFAGHYRMKFYAVIPLFSRRIIAFLTQFSGNLCVPGAWTLCQDNGARIHDILHSFLQIHTDGAQPGFREGLESRCQTVQTVRKRLITGQLGKPIQQMIFGVVVDRLLLKSPLTDAPQVYCYTLLITKLGTEIVTLTLRYRFNCATIVADSAIEFDEICLSHTYIFCSFLLFFHFFNS